MKDESPADADDAARRPDKSHNDSSRGEAPEEPAADAGAPAADAGARSHTSSPPLGSSAADALPRQLSVHDAL